MSAKLPALPDLAGGQVPSDLVYVVTPGIDPLGSFKSNLNDFLEQMPKNITDGVMKGVEGAGLDAAGGGLEFSGGLGTGAGLPGQVALRYPLVGASGTTLQALSTNRFPVQTNFYLNYSTTTTVVNTTVETSLLGAADFGTDTIEAGLARVGRTFRLNFGGVLQNTGTPVLTLRIKLGSVTITTNSGVMTTISGQVVWRVSYLVVVSAIGPTGNVTVSPSIFEYSSVAGNGPAQWLGGSGTVISAPIDFTAPQTFVLTAQWGAASPSNTITYSFGNIDIVR